ncbi:unnamed protein product [Notodromas monacha]|uniref:Uncharacterized protein n=1 Tax=Notodromas monacha TaxID=399045 RepID=A0A7R9BFF4_9CRUS|nr:unnamed protein product [Notodromas monacha]CAG0914296.1 unnamed protein product [Notodromas monacha]
MGNSSSSQSMHLAQHPQQLGFADPRHLVRYRDDPRYADAEEDYLHYGTGATTPRRPRSKSGNPRAPPVRVRAGRSADDVQRRLGISPQNKVLPDVGVMSPKQILRPTELGSILHNGGTITGRRRDLLIAEQSLANTNSNAKNNNNSSSSNGSSKSRSESTGRQRSEERVVLAGKLPDGKYDRIKIRSTGNGSRSGLDEHRLDIERYDSEPRANRRERSLSRILDERRPTRGDDLPARQNGAARHPDWAPKRFDSEPNLSPAQLEGKPPPRRHAPTALVYDPLLEPDDDQDGNVDDEDDGVDDGGGGGGGGGDRRAWGKRPRSKKKSRAPVPPADSDEGIVIAGMYDPRPRSKTPNPFTDASDYRHELASGGRKSASDFLSSLWRRGGGGSQTPDPKNRSKMRIFRPKSEPRSEDPVWGRRSVLELRDPSVDNYSTSPRHSRRRSREAASSRHRARSVDCLQPTSPTPVVSATTSNNHVPASSGNWVNAFSKSMTSLVPENLFGSQRAAVHSKPRLFDPNDTIDSRKSKTSSRSARSKASVKSENKRKSRRDAAVVENASRLDAYKQPQISRSSENLLSSSSRPPSTPAKGVQVLPRQFQKKHEQVNNSNLKQQPIMASSKAISAEVIPAGKKTFYFGMEQQPSASNSANNVVTAKTPVKAKDKSVDEVEKFASRLQSNVVRTNSSGDSYVLEGTGEPVVSAMVNQSSTMSSEDEADIPVKLRPVLPRKHLDMPRFSPTAAWRGILTGQEADPGSVAAAAAVAALANSRRREQGVSQGDRKGSIGGSSNEPDLFEERIIRESSSRQNLLQYRHGHEKSADSGISGDAGSPGPSRDDPDIKPTTSGGGTGGAAVGGGGTGGGGGGAVAAPLAASSPVLRHWTPEQDLDDSMGDGGHGLAPTGAGKATPPKLTHRNAMFSGVARDSLLGGVSAAQPPQSFSSLRKLKRTSSNARRQSGGDPTAVAAADDNWSMSRSVPNSLDHPRPGHRGSGHIVYLPEYRSVAAALRRPRSAMNHGDVSVDDDDDDEGYDNEHGRVVRPHSVHGDATEFAPPLRRRDTSPGSELADMPTSIGKGVLSPIADMMKRKGKKFTYQSTVRQIERRRLEQQLSREAEEKEKQRLREQAVIQKVEEEFRRKRSREKSSIQTQLQELQQSKPAVIHAGNNMDTYAIPNKAWRNAESNNGMVQVRPFKSHPISIAEKSGLCGMLNNPEQHVQQPPPPPLSPPPPLTADDYFPEPAPMPSSSGVSSSSAAGSPNSTNSCHILAGNPAAAPSGFFNGLKSRLTKGGGGSKSSNMNKPVSSNSKMPDNNKTNNNNKMKLANGGNSPNSDRSSGSLSPTRQDPDGAPASAAASVSTGGGRHHNKSSEDEYSSASPLPTPTPTPTSDGLLLGDPAASQSPTESMRREILAASRSRNGAKSPSSSSSYDGQQQPPSSDDVGRQRHSKGKGGGNSRSAYRHLADIAEREEHFAAARRQHRLNNNKRGGNGGGGGGGSRTPRSASLDYDGEEDDEEEVFGMESSDDVASSSVATGSVVAAAATASLTLTQELSEFKEERRDYRDYPQHMWTPRMTPSPYGVR